MQFSDDRDDWFDAHRKDHRFRPALLAGSIVLTVVLWAGLFALFA